MFWIVILYIQLIQHFVLFDWAVCLQKTDYNLKDGIPGLTKTLAPPANAPQPPISAQNVADRTSVPLRSESGLSASRPAGSVPGGLRASPVRNSVMTGTFTFFPGLLFTEPSRGGKMSLFFF